MSLGNNPRFNRPFDPRHITPTEIEKGVKVLWIKTIKPAEPAMVRASITATAMS